MYVMRALASGVYRESGKRLISSRKDSKDSLAAFWSRSDRSCFEMKENRPRLSLKLTMPLRYSA
jgi:hypothetical protein